MNELAKARVNVKIKLNDVKEINKEDVKSKSFARVVKQRSY